MTIAERLKELREERTIYNQQEKGVFLHTFCTFAHETQTPCAKIPI